MASNAPDSSGEDSNAANQEDGNLTMTNNEARGDTYNTQISSGAMVQKIDIGATYNIQNINQIIDNTEKQKLEALSINLKACLEDSHKTVEDRLIFLPCMDEIYREDYLQNHFVPLLLYQCKRDKKLKSPLSGLQELFKDGRRIIIEGEAGFGKSTLARKIAFDWTSSEDYMKRFNFVFYAELRCVGSKSIWDHIVSDLTCEDKDFTEKLLQLPENVGKVLFVLDGLDELVREEWKNKLQQFLNKFVASTVLVTTQPAIKVDRKLYDCKFVVEGFSTDNVDVFITKIIKSFVDNTSDNESDDEDGDDDQSEKLVKEIKQFVTGRHYLNNNLETLLKSPLILCVLCFIFVNRKESSQELPETTSGLYITIMEQLAENYINKKASASQKDRLKQEVEIGLQSFGELALRSLVDDSVTFTEQQIDSCQNGHHVKELLFSRMKPSRRSCTKTTPPVTYQPVQVHKPFLEYLAAFYIKSVKDADQMFDQSIGTFIHTPPLLYSKSAKTDGQRPSMLVTILCGLLKDEAYKFLDKLLSHVKSYFAHFIDVCYLLQHCTFRGRNLECAMKRRVGKQWDLRWLFSKGFESKNDRFLRTLHIYCEILCNILKHPYCPVVKYEMSHIDLLHFDRKEIKKDFQLVLRALQGNKSIKSVALTKNHMITSDFGQDIFLSVYQKVFPAVVQMENLEKIKIHTDIFIENKNLGFTVLKKLFIEVKHATGLKALILKATHKSSEELCEGFHSGEKYRNQQAQKSHPVENIVTAEHVNVLAESLANHAVFAKLVLPKMTISQPVAAKLIEMLKFGSIRVLRLMKMQRFSTKKDEDDSSEAVCRLLGSLSDPACWLEELDLRYFDFNKAEMSHLAEYIEQNETLKTLNLAGSIKSFEIVQPLLQSLTANVVLEKLNISSTHVTVNSYVDLELTMQALFLPHSTSGGSSKDRNLKWVSVSGWSFYVQNPYTIKVVADAVKKSNVADLCLQRAKCLIPVSPSWDTKRCVSEAVGFVKHCLNLKTIDLMKFEVHLRAYNEPVCRADSGFQSMTSVEDEAQSACSDDSLQVNFSDDSETSALLSEIDSEQIASVLPAGEVDSEQWSDVDCEQSVNAVFANDVASEPCVDALPNSEDSKVAKITTDDLCISMFSQVRVFLNPMDLMEYMHS